MKGYVLWNPVLLKSLTIKKQTTKFLSTNFQKMLNRTFIMLRWANSVDLQEVAHQDLTCLQI